MLQIRRRGEQILHAAVVDSVSGKRDHQHASRAGRMRLGLQQPDDFRLLRLMSQGAGVEQRPETHFGDVLRGLARQSERDARRIEHTHRPIHRHRVREIDRIIHGVRELGQGGIVREIPHADEQSGRAGGVG